MPHDPLAIYLNDHLAGSVVAIRLLESLERSMQEQASATTERLTVMHVRREIEEERDVLERLIARVGSAQSPVRKAAGWFAERFAQAKMAVDDDVDGAFRALEQAEVITLGILGKRGLWLALQHTLHHRPELQDTEPRLDLADMVRRSDSQYQRMETVRLHAARSTFARQGQDGPPTHSE